MRLRRAGAGFLAHPRPGGKYRVSCLAQKGCGEHSGAGHRRARRRVSRGTWKGRRIMKDGYVLLCPNATATTALLPRSPLPRRCASTDMKCASRPSSATGWKTPGRAISRPLLFRWRCRSEARRLSRRRRYDFAAFPVSRRFRRSDPRRQSRQQGLSRRTGADRDGLHTGSGRRAITRYRRA